VKVDERCGGNISGRWIWTKETAARYNMGFRGSWWLEEFMVAYLERSRHLAQTLRAGQFRWRF